MRKIVVVEGKNDYQKIKQIAPDLPVVTTNGMVSDAWLRRMGRINGDYEAVLLTDHDAAGDKIREKISDALQNVRNVYIGREDALSKNCKKVGVEHVDLPVLRETLSEFLEEEHQENITIQDLYALGLVGGSESKKRRIKLCEKLDIDYANGKQLARHLNLFQISLERIREILCSIM